MKKFSELNISIPDARKIFTVPVVSIQEIINCEIEVIDFDADVKTKHGDGRYVVKFRHEGLEKKFFTNAKQIKDVLEKVEKTDMPFQTIIRIQSFGSGSGKSFYFT